MKLEVELDDKGEFIGDLPSELKTILERRDTAAHGVGFGKGAQKAAEEAKKQIADAIKAKQAELEAQQPLERAKWAEVEELNKTLKSQIETMATDSRKNLTAREEAHALETTSRMESMKKRDDRIRTLVNANLRALAAQAGARDESLSELEVILQHRIGYDDDMVPFVKDEQDATKAAKTAAGNVLPLDVFVRQYLDNHPHHRKPVPGKGGGAQRGASLSGHQPPSSVAAAAKRIDEGDRSPQAINDLYLAGRKGAAA